jgi:hypothetical protein
MSEGPASRSRQSSQMAGIAAVVTAAIAFAAVLGLWHRGGGGFDTAWLPSWDARLAFRLDGLGALYAVLATGVGVAVFAYATAYVPRHLEREGRPQAEGRRFHALMVLFMMAMVGLSTAQDLLVLFVFWDLTAITSYYLIGFDRQHREARLSALMALLVTGVSAVLLLIGILIVRAELGTTSIPELLGRVGQGGPMLTLAGALIAAGEVAGDRVEQDAALVGGVAVVVAVGAAKAALGGRAGDDRSGTHRMLPPGWGDGWVRRRAGSPPASAARADGLGGGVARHVVWDCGRPAGRLLPVDPDHGGLQQVVVVTAGGLGEEAVDLFLGHPGLAQGRGGAAQDGEGVAVLAGQLHLDFGVAGLGGILRRGWGAGRRVGVVAGEEADPVAGVGQDGQGAAVVPGDVDGGLGGVGNAGDGAAVTGPQAGVGVVGGDQLDAVAGGAFHGGLPAARGGDEPSWWRAGSGRSPSWAP